MTDLGVVSEAGYTDSPILLREPGFSKVIQQIMPVGWGTNLKWKTYVKAS